MSISKRSLEDCIPGWTDKLFKIRKDIARYEGEKSDLALCIKEMKFAEARLLKNAEEIQSALESDDQGLLDVCLQQYNQGG